MAASDEREIDRLVQAVVERVLARVAGPGASTTSITARRRQVLVLLAAPSAHLAALAERVEAIRRAGWPVRVLGSTAALRELEGVGLRERFGKDVENVEQAGIARALAELRPGDVTLLATAGFALVRRLRDLDDDDPFVRLVAQGLLRGQHVLLATDDLAAAVPASRNEAARRAETLLRDVAGMGVEPIRVAEIPALLDRLVASDVTVSQAVGQLLTEADVEKLRAAGETRLVLAARTIVTPLARSRAAELGLELVEKGAG